jgi:glycine/D-amino acid oxidase-like deaminating enzyme
VVDLSRIALTPMEADVIVVGAGLAGLVAAGELVERGNTVLVVEQENAANLGAQAFWSVGGLSSSTVPNQRRVGHPRQPRTCAAGLARHRRLRLARRLLATAVGERLCGFRRR